MLPATPLPNGGPGDRSTASLRSAHARRAHHGRGARHPDALARRRRCCTRSAAGPCSIGSSMPPAARGPIASSRSSGRTAASPSSVGDGVEVAEQREGEGTASAVDAARELLSGRGHDPAALRRPPADHERAPRRSSCARTRKQGADATMLTTDTLDPTAYGRIVRDKKGRVARDRRDEGRDQGRSRAPRDPRDQPRHLRLQRPRAVRRARARSSRRTTASAT